MDTIVNRDHFPQDPTIAVLGAGSWGTALAVHLAKEGRPVRLWARRKEAAASIDRERRNWHYLPKALLPMSIAVSSDLKSIVEGAGVWIFAVPAQAIRKVAEAVRPFVSPEKVIISVAKGIEQKTLMTPSQILMETLSSVPQNHIGALYGPSHAEELAVGMPTTVVAAATDDGVATYIQHLFMGGGLRVYVNLDLIGVEIAGSVKNVMAIAAGISDGIGGGDNAKAALITRGIAEISRLGRALGATPSTFAGLAGIGDLVVTCTSRHSRNRYLGEQIGRGRKREEVEEEMQMVAEGVNTTASVVALAKRHGVDMPITQGVHDILFENKSPQVALTELMARAAKREDYTADFCPN